MLLAFETSCDETSAAVIERGRVLSNVVSSQVQLHAEYGGVVPELATREHLRNLAPLTRTALRQAQATTAQLDAVAATRGPGLPSALLVGYDAAQALAFALRRPFFGVHHHEAHLYSVWITGDPLSADFNSFEPNISLIVSGGHTMLAHAQAPLKHRLLGATLDDAAGECFDKIARLIGLPYPGGPVLDRLAEQGNPKAFVFPRPLLNDPNDDFSFSGLKTAVLYTVHGHGVARGAPPPPGPARADVAASFQRAVVVVLVAKARQALRRTGLAHVVIRPGKRIAGGSVREPGRTARAGNRPRSCRAGCLVRPCRPARCR